MLEKIILIVKQEWNKLPSTNVGAEKIKLLSLQHKRLKGCNNIISVIPKVRTPLHFCVPAFRRRGHYVLPMSYVRHEIFCHRFLDLYKWELFEIVYAACIWWDVRCKLFSRQSDTYFLFWGRIIRRRQPCPMDTFLLLNLNLWTISGTHTWNLSYFHF